MPVNKNGIVVDIESDTKSNKDFRRVIFTGSNIQLVLMSVLPGQELGMEVHPGNDQFFRVDAGSGTCVINGIRHDIKNGSAFIIPQGVQHNVIAGPEGLKVYTIYGPPHHPDYTVNATKTDAIKMEKAEISKAAFLNELEKIALEITPTRPDTESGRLKFFYTPDTESAKKDIHDLRVKKKIFNNALYLVSGKKSPVAVAERLLASEIANQGRQAVKD